MIENSAPKPDLLLEKIADYVHDYTIVSETAFQTAHLALLDSLGCGIQALKEKLCFQLLGPWVEGMKVPLGVRVPGTHFSLDPIKAAFDIGCLIRWLDYNDTWLAKEWGHPSDNLGAILAAADFLNQRQAASDPPLTMHQVLEAMIKAYEIQGILALENAFNEVGLDHVLLVKIASTAVLSVLFKFSKSQTIDALSQAWIDGHSLRTYRQAPNTGPRKSWAAADASSRAMFLCWVTEHGQPGYLSALTAKRFGFQDVYLKGKEVVLAQPLENYVMENILFKVVPAEFHAQTAVEAAIRLYPGVKNKWDKIAKIKIKTQSPAMRIIHKTGPLLNYADRDHCLEYMVAIGLLFGRLEASHYQDETAKDPRIDNLRAKMEVKEDPEFSREYLDKESRSVANSVQVFFEDGSHTEEIVIHYPYGHKRRRDEMMGLLKAKYVSGIQGHFLGEQSEKLIQFWDTPGLLTKMPVKTFMDQWVVKSP